MVRNKLNRIKAAVVSVAMVATTFAAPVMNSFTSVTAAVAEVKSLPHTFVADGVEDGPRQANVALPSGTKAGDTIYLNFTTSSTVNASIGVYGFGTDSEADKYWYSIPTTEQPSFSSGGKSSFECKVVIPTAMKGNPTKIGIGVWYPEDSSEWTLESIKTSSGGSTSDPSDPDPVEPNIPVSANAKSGTYTFTDNKNGTATITATLSAQYAEKDADGNDITQFDFLLTQGHDEEDYAPYKDADGNELPERGENDPINSHKFAFSNFGIDDMSNTLFQSFEYVIKSDDYDMSTIQYGGGINVEAASPADTEYAKGKNGYWYNDQGTEDLEKYASKFAEAGIVEDVHSGYEATGCGSYAKLTWDVPVGVQPYVDLSNSSNSVGFQYWWGKDDTKESTNDKGDTLNYAEIPEIHLVSCTATYTRSMTVPYNATVEGPSDTTLTQGDDATNQVKFPLADIELGERDKLSAVKFSFKSAEAMNQFVGACGISVDPAKVQEAAGVVDGWYQTGNIAVINSEGTFDVMWILPEAIRNGVYPDGEVLMGYWYGDVEGGEKLADVTISDVEYYVYRTKEEDMTITDSKGMELPEEIELEVGDTYSLIVNVNNCTFESDRTAVATVTDSGIIKAEGAGLAKVTVTTPEGQTATVVVRVTEPEVTTAATTTVVTTTTTTTATTVDPDTVIDWGRVLYGDVNVDGSVALADVVVLSKHLVNTQLFPLLNATAKENANCQYDDNIDNFDNIKLIEYNSGVLTLLDLGPEDKSNCPMYETPDIKKLIELQTAK